MKAFVRASNIGGVPPVVEFQGLLWDGSSPTSSSIFNNVVISIDDNEKDIQEKIIEKVMLLFGIAKHDVIIVFT